MRQLKVINGNFTLSDDIELIYEKTVSSFGTSAKVDCQKKHIGKRAYIVILKEPSKKLNSNRKVKIGKRT